MALQHEEQQHDRQRHDDRGRRELAPLDGLLADVGEIVTGSVNEVGSSISVKANTNSFHAVMNENSAVTDTAGIESGKMMRQKIVNWLAPSMMALSSSSFGMVSK